MARLVTLKSLNHNVSDRIPARAGVSECIPTTPGPEDNPDDIIRVVLSDLTKVGLAVFQHRNIGWFLGLWSRWVGGTQCGNSIGAHSSFLLLNPALPLLDQILLCKNIDWLGTGARALNKM